MQLASNAVKEVTMTTIEQIISEIKRLPEEWHKAGTVPDTVLDGILKHLNNRTILHSMETGSGKTTLLFSHISQDHKVFSVDAGHSLSFVRDSPLLNRATVEFFEGPSQLTLPAYTFTSKLQLAFIDGPHGYPFPDMEYLRIYPHLEENALLIIDDIHIPTIHHLFDFLKEDDMFSLIDVIENTAIFERTNKPTFATTEDGWWLQNYNKKRFPIDLLVGKSAELLYKNQSDHPEINDLLKQIEVERNDTKALIKRIEDAKAYRLLKRIGRWKWFTSLAERCIEPNDHIPVFSIITPSYNQANFIAETIESVLSQAGEFKIEYLVMDGGSTDNSVEIIKHYADLVASGDWNVHCAGVTLEWVSQPDKGQADAINQGMRRSTGSILSYINSDDAFCPGAFKQVAQAFSAQPQADFIYGDGDVIDEQSNLQWEWLSRPYDRKVMKSYHFLWNDFTNYILQQATFWRRRAVEKIGYFDETFHYALDVEYWIRAGETGLKLQHIPFKLGKFRMIPGTKSLSSLTAFWGDQLEIFRRYRGINNLSIFFAYYYYNLAKQSNFLIEKMQVRDPGVFSQWDNLPLADRQQIEKQANLGLAKAFLLMANDLLLKQPERANSLFKKGVASRSYLIFHSFAIIFGLRSIMGHRVLDQDRCPDKKNN